MNKNLVALISKISDLTNKLIISELEKNNIKDIVPSHGSIFVLLYKKEKVTMREIADFIRKTKPTVTTLVDKLVRLGFLQKEKSDIDSRVTFVQLTEKGKLLKPIFEEISKKMNNIVYKDINTEDEIRTQKILEKIINNLSN
ncbi:MAG: MarR family transcriptional regulator [Arcobacter sp.]|nr:MAG: MarR family transcriptional regulator [Arcobacter sp.]